MLRRSASRSSAARGAPSSRRKRKRLYLECGNSLGRFMIRALDWLRAAISALLETSMRRLRLVGCRPSSTPCSKNWRGAKRGQFRLGSTPIVCKNRWECALRFYVEFRAAADASIEHWRFPSARQLLKFGRAPPSARCDVRPACKLRPGDGQHPATPRRAPEPLALQFERDRRAAPPK